jgi:sulfur-carrier protein
MAVVHVPRSLAALFPGVPRRLEVPADDLADLIRGLDARYPGMWDRLCQPGPRLRPHINAFVDGQPAIIDAPLTAVSVVHLIPAVSGGTHELGPVPDGGA